MKTEELAKAIYTVNRHAKAALEPQHLYEIKKRAIDQLLRENKAKKIGLHFTKRPKHSNQHSMLLIKVDEYYFHIPPTREDFKQLKHLGDLDDDYRNKRVRMSLSTAKQILYDYLNWQPKKKSVRDKYYSNYYTPSSLGQWPPKQKDKY
ncbi:MAG TPA: YkyB family protein [Bacillota bacterium]|nr:YkyB family protein [Bacillota bacterium]